MQSAIWKAVALAGVIGIGCYVVYEVHRRLPAPQAGPATADQFKHLEGGASVLPENGASAVTSLGPQSEPGDPAEAGQSAAFDPLGSEWDRPSMAADREMNEVPAQAEPTDALTTGAETDRDAPWSWDNEQSSAPDTASESPFAPRTMPAVSHQTEGTEDPEDLFGAPEQRPVADTGNSSPAGFESPSTDSATSVAEFADSPPDTGVRTLAGGESQATATLAEFTDESAAGNAAAATDTMSDATDLFGPDPGDRSESPFADSSASAGARADESGGFGDELPAPSAAGRVASGPPSLPPQAETDPFSTTGVADDAGASPSADEQAAETVGSQHPADDPSSNSAVEPSQPPLGLVLPLDEPAEFPLGAGADEPSAMPAGDDAAPFVIEPARERTATGGDTPPAVMPRLDFVGDGTIGEQTLSGPQQPELKVEKVAPPEATVGEPLVYAIRVTNTGRSAAHDVVVEDRIPRGTTLDGTIPRAELADKRLTWRLGTIEPGGEQMIRVRVVPNQAGEIGSVATVRFVAEVAAATMITRPELALEMTAPSETAVGEQVVFHFVVTNRGTGDARDVVIRSLLPAGLEHPDGDDIEYPLGRIRAGESREIELAVTAGEPGQLRGQGLVTIGSKTYAQEEAPVTVIPSRLLIRREGPARRFVNSRAEYVTTITNRSSRDLQQVTVEEQLPPGLELASMPEGAQFDRGRRTITWRFPQLRAGESTVVRTGVVGQSPGTMEVVMRAGDASGNKAVLASKLEVAGVSSLAVDFSHDGRPVAVGEKVALTMTVTNRGTAPAQGVQALFEIPENMEFVTADGPVDYEQEGRIVRFAAVDEIKASGRQTFDIVLTAAESGTQRVTAQLMAPNFSEPLRNDEAVVVEGDE